MKTLDKELSLEENTILNNKYKIKKAISVSHLSIVYLADNNENDEMVIIKEFFPKQLVLRDLDNKSLVVKLPSIKKQFSNLKEQFINETNILKNCSHSNIIPFIDSFEENETAYLVMKYCDGQSLDSLIKKEAIDKEKLYNEIFIPIIKAITYIHKKGIIHRDIKPSNILIDKSGVPYLIDFGSAIYYKTSNKNKIFTTPGYSPLELYSQNEKLGKKTDIYSFAATLYFSLTGGATPIDCSKRIIEDPMKNIKKFNHEISLIFSFVIMWGLALQPKRRCFSLKLFEFAIIVEKILGKFKHFKI